MQIKFRKIIPLLFILGIFSILLPNTSKEKLIVFHFDFNSVTLKKDYILKWIEKASSMGYNAILWEIEDEIQWETCPECSSVDALSKSEFKEILNYSKQLGLEPIPLLQTIGHGEYVLQHAKYFGLREDSSRYDCYCSTNSDVRAFIKKWIKEYIELFGELKYFHLGGDEAYAFGSCNNCKSVIEKSSENKLYAEYLVDIAQPLVEADIRPGIWSDMMLTHPDEINEIPKDFIIWDWNYWDGDYTPNVSMVWGKGRMPLDKLSEKDKKNFKEILDEDGKFVPFYTADYLKNNNFDVILSSTSRSHGDGVFIGRNNLHVNNIYGAAHKTNESNLLGTCVTSWAVRIPNFETQEPWLKIAPLTIQNPEMGKEQILNFIAANLFGLNNTDIFNVIEQIGYSYPFVNTNTTGIMWTGLKDSKAAPSTYIEDYISRRMKQDVWKEYEKQINISTSTISDGIDSLNQIIPMASKGYEILYNYSKGAKFNYWHSIIARHLVLKANGQLSNYNELVQLIENLKIDYIDWANDWMTEESAKQNAGLIYNAIQNYFKEH